MKILPSEVTHYDRVYQLWEQCEGIGLSESDSLDNITIYLNRNKGLSFIAVLEGEIVGMTFQNVPEPATMLLLGTGLIGLVGLKRKKRA